MLLDLLASQLPTDFWHDPFLLTMLAIVATLLAGVIGAIVAYWVYRAQRSKREITYQVISDAPVINIDKAVADRVTITLDGDPVTTEVRLVVLKLWNSGNTAVRREDYDESLVLTFNGGTVVSWDVLETTPPELKTYLKQLLEIPITAPPSPSLQPQTQSSVSAPIQEGTTPQPSPPPLKFIELPKFLLNKGQSTSLTILLKGEKSEISMAGRIVDGGIVKYVASRDAPWWIKFSISIFAAIISVIFIGAFSILILLKLSVISGTSITLSTDEIWAVIVFITFLLGHISGIVMTIRAYRHREYDIHVVD